MDDMGSESTSILRNLKFWKLDFQGSGFDTDRVQSSESYPLMFGGEQWTGTNLTLPSGKLGHVAVSDHGVLEGWNLSMFWGICSVYIYM